MGRFRDHGLTIVLMTAAMFSVAAMAASGWLAYGQELARHGAPAIGFVAYLASGDFISAIFENWESEFLQMSAYVMLTAFLYQRGSAESKDPDGGDEKETVEPTEAGHRLDGFGAWLYSYSLGIALGLLFLLSFVLHLMGSWKAANAEALLHGEMPHSLVAHLADAGFWFESFQNWQSEFLSTAVLVVLSIFLRFRGSPESKPVNAANARTGA